jgi:hypothetical protein
MTITEAFLILIFVAVALYTAIASQLKQRAVSPTLRDAAYRWSSLATLGGVLVGHWFGPTQNPISHRVGSVLPVLIGVFLFDLYWIKFHDARRTWWKWPLFWFALGVVAGIFLWAQRAADAPF